MNSGEYPFRDLKPASVWKHFAELCRIPRQSKHEEAVRDFLKQWASSQGLENRVEAGGNLIIKKPASAGYENAPGVILQAHLDMVCQKNEGVEHDFSKDPIKPVVRDNLVLAEDTTLGADDGIGVALILAAFEDKTLVHGPLEALLPVDEEEGMGGANQLEKNVLSGQILLNLDSETWGDFCLGCAGGADVIVQRTGRAEPFPTAWKALKIDISGLRGGHSGINIHEGRGNAIKLLTRILCSLERQFPLCLSSFTGGTARNAIPREASAVIGIQEQNMISVSGLLQKWQDRIMTELAGVDEACQIKWSTTSADKIMSSFDQRIWLLSLNAAPHGVWRMTAGTCSPETSNNLGTINLQSDTGTCTFMVRSTIESACNALTGEIISLFMLSGIQPRRENAYPGWAPDMNSPLLALCRQIYKREFGSEPATHIIHAGLECGILKSKYPELDMISFGPTIHSPHAPGESVEIDTVEKSWQLLQALLKAIAIKA